MIMCPAYCDRELPCDDPVCPAEDPRKCTENDPVYIVPNWLDRARAFALVGLLREVNFIVDSSTTKVYLYRTATCMVPYNASAGNTVVRKSVKRFETDQYIRHLKYLLYVASRGVLGECIVDEKIDDAIKGCVVSGGNIHVSNVSTILQSQMNLIAALKCKLVPTTMNDPAEYRRLARSVPRRITLSAKSSMILSDLFAYCINEVNSYFYNYDRLGELENKVNRDLILDVIELMLIFSSGNYFIGCSEKISYEYTKNSNLAVSTMTEQMKYLRMFKQGDRVCGPCVLNYREPEGRLVSVYERLKHLSPDAVMGLGNILTGESYWITDDVFAEHGKRTNDAVEVYLWYEIYAQIFKMRWEEKFDNTSKNKEFV